MEREGPSTQKSNGASSGDSEFIPSTFDTSQFVSVIKVLALRVPKGVCDVFKRKLQNKNLLLMENMKCVQPDPTDDAFRNLLLAPSIQSIDAVPEEVVNLLESEKPKGAKVHTMELQLSYKNFSADEIMRKLIPAHVEVPTAYETVGHIVHLNLREEQLPYKKLIGEVLLLKLPRMSTVVNKTSNIQTEFRTFPMELLAGVPNYETEVRESGCRLKMNYAEVYWNSRLQMEHGRLVSLCAASDVIFDMFAGVGPFAVPAAKRGCLVFANDLNPRSYHYLTLNAKLNHVQHTLKAFNLDAREFIRRILPELPAICSHKPPITCIRVIMNLPALSITFLDVLNELNNARGDAGPTIRVHCYCFSSSENPAADVIKRGEEVLGMPLPGAEAFEVRDVAPHKLMMCLSFVLPAGVRGKRNADGGGAVAASPPADAHEPKKSRLEG